ncbi:MAG: hypothetical protein LBB23_01085 [Rickettsiales bacterium]|nr:hypothetical protein [Rickettsiales bacterium]
MVRTTPSGDAGHPATLGGEFLLTTTPARQSRAAPSPAKGNFVRLTSTNHPALRAHPSPGWKFYWWGSKFML